MYINVCIYLCVYTYIYIHHALCLAMGSGGGSPHISLFVMWDTLESFLKSHHNICIIQFYVHQLNEHTKLTKHLERIAFCAASELSYTDARISWLNKGDPPVHVWFAAFFWYVQHVRCNGKGHSISDRQDLFVLGKSIVWNSQLLHIPFKNLQELSVKKLPYLSKWSVNLSIKKI